MTPRHGLTDTRIYGIWQRMKKRCYTANFAGYARCGGRGIKVCDEWRHDLTAFVADVSQLEHYNCPGYDIYRIDLARDYEPGNVRFVSAKERARNRQGNRRISFAGKTQCLMDWAEELGINYPALVSRLRHGWSVERAFTTPIRKDSSDTPGIYFTPLDLYRASLYFSGKTAPPPLGAPDDWQAIACNPPFRSDNYVAGGNHFVNTIKVLPFHFYPFPGAMPIICEIDSDGYVYMSHADQVIHRSKYSGQFVMLVELHGEQEGEQGVPEHGKTP
jgi:hypothetical protein